MRYYVLRKPQVTYFYYETYGYPRENNFYVNCDTSTEIAEEKKDNKLDYIKSEFSKKREINALKHKLKTAIKNEEFEECSILRDKIHKMENNI